MTSVSRHDAAQRRAAGRGTAGIPTPRNGVHETAVPSRVFPGSGVAAALRRVRGVMEELLKITFHGVEPTPAIEAKIRDRFAKLEQLSDGIVACHVTVDAPHRHHHKGTIFNVRIDLTVKHGEIVVGRDPAHDHAHEDLYVAIRDSFDVARRLLQDHVRKQRGDVKHHREPASI